MSAIPKTAHKWASRVMHWDDERSQGNAIIVTLTYGWCFEEKGLHVFGNDTVGAVVADLKRTQPCDCARCLSKQGG